MGVLCTDGDDEEGDGEDDDYIDDEDNYEKGDTSNIEIDVVVVLIVFIVGKSFSHVPFDTIRIGFRGIHIVSFVECIDFLGRFQFGYVAICLLKGGSFMWQESYVFPCSDPREGNINSIKVKPPFIFMLEVEINNNFVNGSSLSFMNCH